MTTLTMVDFSFDIAPLSCYLTMSFILAVIMTRLRMRRNAKEEKLELRVATTTVGSLLCELPLAAFLGVSVYLRDMVSLSL